jgi:hydrogenase/urease accessory protein HupE
MRTALPWRFLQLPMLALVAGAAVAHESRPVYVELTETSPQRYLLQWKMPPSVPEYSAPTITLSKECEPDSPAVQFSGPDGLVRRTGYHCSQGVAGRVVTIAYPGPNPSISSLISYRALSGERHLQVLGPQKTSWTVPTAETAARVAHQYVLLGTEHIWSGVDHLLFLVCLLWIAGTWRRILITVTGFTLAHSMTLGASALGIVRVPIPPVEAAIALSILFLATELVKGPRHSLTWRNPIAVSTSFGLLHGFGFAAALSDFGLPQTDLVLGLLSFNVGVELGQVAVVAGVMGTVRLVQWLGPVPSASPPSWMSMPRTAAGYAVGAIAVFWLIQRSAAFVPPGLGG